MRVEDMTPVRHARLRWSAVVFGLGAGALVMASQGLLVGIGLIFGGWRPEFVFTINQARS